MSGGRDGRVVIAGAGLAGVQTAVRLREAGFDGAVTLVGEERERPYDRPPVSKDLLLGKADDAPLEVDFAALGVDLELGRTATGVRPAERLLDTDAGPLRYDHLVLATGSAAVRLPGAWTLRTPDDARRLRGQLASGEAAVAVGAGWIGAEFATAARAAGCPVTVLEAADRPLAGALPADVTGPMRRWYREAGARLRTGAEVRAVRSGEVELADGSRLEAHAVVAGIGSRPATGWLRGSGIGLAADGSVAADARLRAGAPGVWAAGDCASYPSARYARRLLVHHWDNALQGPRAVAAGITGSPEPYDPVPYFWSEQFGRMVQLAGLAGEGTPVWRGSPEDDASGWAVGWLRDGRLTGLLAVDRPRDLTQARRLIERGAEVDAARLADPSAPVKAAAR